MSIRFIFTGQKETLTETFTDNPAAHSVLPGHRVTSADGKRSYKVTNKWYVFTDEGIVLDAIVFEQTKS